MFPCFAQVALSKEFSGTRRSHASSDSGPTLYGYHDFFMGTRRPLSSAFGSAERKLPGRRVMRGGAETLFLKKKKKNKVKKNSGHTATGEVEVSEWLVGWGGKCGGGILP